MAQHETSSAHPGEGQAFTSPIDAALRYASIGWPVFPCRPFTSVADRENKKPLTTHGFQEATTDTTQIVEWWRKWPHAQIGVATEAASLCVIDLDLKPEEGLDGPAAWLRLKDEHGADMCGLIASTPRGGRHYVYVMPEGGVRSGSDIVKGSGIDVRANGGYIVVPSPASPDRSWIVGDPFEVSSDGETDLGGMPEWVRNLVTRERRAFTTGGDGGASSRALPLDERQVARIRSALDWVENDTRDSWLHVGMALKSTSAGQQAYDLWVEWSKRTATGAVHPKFDEKDQRYQWRSIREFRHNGTEITLGTLFHLAKLAGWAPTLEEELEIEAEQLARQAEAIAAEVAPKAAAAVQVRPFPLELMNCPGLVGEMADWMVRSSTRPQPALCLASTLCALGALLGRRVASPTDLRTNLYALGIGETGCGKDPSVKLPQMLFAHAGLSKFIGPGEWKSDSGLRAALVAEPSHVCLIDEFTKALAVMSGRQVPPHILGIKSYLLRLFPLANGVFLAPAYADRKMNAPVEIPEPNLCVYGTGVPSELFSSLDRGAVQDGFLNRFLVFLVDEQQPKRQRVSRAVPPVDLIDGVKALDLATKPKGNLQGVGSGMASATGCRTIPHDAEASEFLAALEVEIDAKVAHLRSKSDPLVDLWLRFIEHVVKVALIRSVADDATRPTNVHDLRWAYELVLWCTERTAAIAESHVADSQQEAATKRVLRLIAGAGPGGITSAALTRKTQWLRSGDRKDILTTLESGNQIARKAIQSAGRPSVLFVATTPESA